MTEEEEDITSSKTCNKDRIRQGREYVHYIQYGQIDRLYVLLNTSIFLLLLSMYWGCSTGGAVLIEESDSCRKKRPPETLLRALWMQ